MNSKKQNPPLGSTRKEMTQAEKDWLKDFDQAFYKNDSKSLERIVPKDKIFTDVLREQNAAHNARRNDIYENEKAVHVGPLGSVSLSEALDSLIATDNALEHHIEDETLAPKYDLDRYTPEDYNPASFPDEDALIAAIDYDREEAEKKKVKSFKEFVERYKKGKGYDPAS